MKVVTFYVGSSLLAPLTEAERETERRHALGLRIRSYNCGAPLCEQDWQAAERDLAEAEIVFIMHVTDGDNGARLISLLERHAASLRAVVVINCMPDLMRRTRMGRLSFGRDRADSASTEPPTPERGRARTLLRSVGTWMGEQAQSFRRGKPGERRGHGQYLKFVERLPALLRFVPSAGRLGDVKHYLQLFCYFLQPTPANIRSMVLYALKHYGTDERLRELETLPVETLPAVGIYHPDAPALFESFEAYAAWYERRHRQTATTPRLAPRNTVGLLLMRTQIVSRTRGHYDTLIRTIESAGLAVLPAISTFMDNREACRKYFMDGHGDSRVSQILSLTGFSFVGGPAMNDSEAAVEFLRELNCPLRSAVSLDVQTIESWQASPVGLNPVQAGMQVAIPEIDGATEPFVYGGLRAGGTEPLALEERCRRMAERLARWNRLQQQPRSEVRLAVVLFCFPPNKGNIGTAAELDVFESLVETLRRLGEEGYQVDVPADADALRERLLGGNSERFGSTANVAYRMQVDEYLRLCPYADEIEAEWGRAPGSINAFGGELLIQGAQFGHVFVGVQPTFGYEGDPMRLLNARSGSPHHGFAALYTYIEKIFRADALIHLGTHGALEFMPGKQVGLSGECWPDRLAGVLPHLYLYSVNNPSEGSIARRRSYAELLSYLTPPVSDAGVYKELAALKDLLHAYRQTADEREREQLYETIEAKASALHFD